MGATACAKTGTTVTATSTIVATASATTSTQCKIGHQKIIFLTIFFFFLVKMSQTCVYRYEIKKLIWSSIYMLIRWERPD